MKANEKAMVLILAGILLAQLSTGDVLDKDGRWRGTIKESPYGGFDLYDSKSSRLGYGRTSPHDPRLIELFDSRGNRLGTIRRGPQRSRDL